MLMSATKMIFSRGMRSYIIASSLLALAIEPALVGSGMQAPPAGARTDQAVTAAPKVSRPLPFVPGEVLIYDIGFSKLVFSGSIGQLKLTVKNGQATARKDSAPPAKSSAAQEPTELKKPNALPKPQAQVNPPAASVGRTDRPANIEFSAEVVSKGFFTWLFGIKIEDSYGAIVSSDDFGLLRSWKEIDQGDLHRRNETKVDRELSTISYSESDRKSPGVVKVKTGNSPQWILDLLSLVYFIRTQELKDGKVITIPITDVGQVYMIDLIPGKREEVAVEAGKFKSIQIDLKIFDGKYIRRSGQLWVWLSDDARRLPVRARLKSSGTTVNITLAHYERLS
jgi:hypothetical protein